MKWVKRLLLGIALVVVVLIAAAVVLVVTFDPNDYKDLIVREVNKATGRQLTLEGDIKLALFPWLGMRLGTAYLSNAEGFGADPFARVEEAQVRVAILPLFRGEVSADTLRLNGLHVNLSKNARGVTNWDDLISKQKAQKPPPEPEATGDKIAPAALEIGGIEIMDAALRWQDAQGGTDLTLSPFNLRTDAITLGEPFNLKLELRALNKTPPVEVSVNLKGLVNLDLERQRYRITDLNTTLEAQGETLPTSPITANLKMNLDADLEAQTLRVSPLTLEALTLQLLGHVEVTQLLADPRVKAQLKSQPFSPREVLKALDQPSPPTADPDVLKRANIDIALNANTTQAELTQLALLFDDTQIIGSGKVKTFEKPDINFSLAINEIDADRYLPPKAQQPDQPADAQPAPPTPADDRLALPLEPLRNLNMKGELKVGKIKVANLRLADLKATLTAKNGLLELKPVRTSLYQGRVNTAVKLDARRDIPGFSVSTNLESIAIGDLMQDLQASAAYLRGTSNLSFNLNTRGDRISSLKQQLGGKVNLAVSEGALRDPKLAGMVERVIAFLKKREPAPTGEEILFKSLSGSAVINQGVARNNDLALVSQYILAKGKGDVDLGKETIDYELGVALARDRKLDKKRTYVPITVKGPFTDPNYGVDLSKVAKQKLQEEAEKEQQKLQEKLDRKIEKEREDLQKKLEEKLRDKLKLF